MVMAMVVAMAMATMIVFAMEMAMAMMSMSMRMSMRMRMSMPIQHEHDHGDNPETCFFHVGPYIYLVQSKTVSAGHSAAEAQLDRPLCSKTLLQTPEINKTSI